MGKPETFKEVRLLDENFIGDDLEQWLDRVEDLTREFEMRGYELHGDDHWEICKFYDPYCIRNWQVFEPSKVIRCDTLSELEAMLARWKEKEGPVTSYCCYPGAVGQAPRF